MIKKGDEYEVNGMKVFVVDIDLDDGFVELRMTSDGKDLIQPMKWCECGGIEDPDNETFYYEVWFFKENSIDNLQERHHGWGCVKCRGITQTG